MIRDMEISGWGTESCVDSFEDHQPECVVVQFKEPDEDVPMNAAEREAVSGPVVTLAHRLHSTESALESVSLHKIHLALIDALPEVEQTNGTTAETEKCGAGIQIEPQEQSDLEGPVIKRLGDLDYVETTSKLEPQTPHKDQSSPNHYLKRSLHLTGDSMLHEEIEETRMDPKARGDHPESLPGPKPEHLATETCFNSEIQFQVTDTEFLEPAAKKRLRRRMGMCGLGDRKRKFPFDGQLCKQGRQMEDESGKGNKVVWHLYNSVLENDRTTPMDHEGSTRPECDENEETLADKENEGSAVTDNERTLREAEKETTYALINNMNVFSVLMNDEGTTDESFKETRGILEENCATIVMDDNGHAKQVAFEYELIGDILTGFGETLSSSTFGKKLNMIPEELLVDADHVMESATRDEEPNNPGTYMTCNVQDIDLTMKHVILSENLNLQDEDKDNDDHDDDVTGVDVSSSSVCVTAEMSDGSYTVPKDVQEVSTDFRHCKMELEETCPPNNSATEKHDRSGSELCGPAEQISDPLFVDDMSIASTDIHKGHSEHNKPSAAIPVSTEPVGGDTDCTEEIRDPTAPATGQENTTQWQTLQVCKPGLTSDTTDVPQGTGLSSPSSLYMTDSQLHKVALSMELEDLPVLEVCGHQEDATELVHGLITELSSLKYD